MLTRKSVVLAKIEGTYGLDPVPTPGANALLIHDLDIKPSGETIKRQALRSTLSQLRFRRGSKLVDVSFKTEMMGTGTRGVVPAYGYDGPLFRACGFSETVDPAVSIVYQPVSEAFESVTLYVYKDGLFHAVTGCRGSVQISAEVGKTIICSWTFQGLYTSPVDASPAAQTFSDVDPPIAVNASFAVGGYAAIINKLELDINNSRAVRKSINAAEGILGVEITGREPQGSFDPEVVTEATEDFWAKWEAAEAVALAIGPIGATPGNVIEIDAPAVQYRELGYGDRDGVSVYAVPFDMALNLGDDELVITIS